MSRKIAIQINLEPEQYLALKRVADATRIGMSTHVRDAIAEWLEKRAREEGKRPA